MTLTFAKPRDVVLHYHLRAGETSARPVVFLNSLGTDFRIWQGVSNHLPDSPALRMDKRGHGLSDMGAISMAMLAQDVADLMDLLGLSGAVLCSVSVGGMIAQLLAVARPDLVAGLVLCNTGTRIGDAESWNSRINAVHASGLEQMADQILQRWFSKGFRDAKPTQIAGYRNMLSRTNAEAYADTCAAIRDTDLSSVTERINVPTVCIAGREDQATPPALVSALARQIAGAKLQIIENVGHLPCIERPDLVSQQVKAILQALS